MGVLTKRTLQAVLGPLLLTVVLVSQLAIGQQTNQCVQIHDSVTIEGVQDKPLVGYGMVIGLAGTGDRRQTMFSTQMLDNVLLKMGGMIPAASVKAKNVAAVFVTASLPPFSSPGTQIEVTVSSIGDATSLKGGTLLMAPLYGADGQVYAEAQGRITIGGAGDSQQVNHFAVGRIPDGGLVERAGMPMRTAQQREVGGKD